MAFVALVPWLWAMRHVGSWPTAVASGLIFGVVAGLGVGAWLPEALGAHGLPTLQAHFLWFVTAFWVTGVPMLILAAVLAACSRSRPVFWLAAVTVGVFAMDTGRSYAPGGVPWGLLGHSQWEAEGIAQLAVIAGVPAVSAFVAAVNAVLSLWLENPRSPLARSAVGAAGGAVLAILLAGVPVLELVRDPSRAKDVRVLLVQPDYPSEERWMPSAQRTNLRELHRLTLERVLIPDPDLVVWPEAALTTPLDSDPVLKEELTAAAQEIGVPIVAGLIDPPRSGRAGYYANAAVWMDPDTGLRRDAVEKAVAIPVVESGQPFPGSRLIERLLSEAALNGRRVEEAWATGPLKGTLETAPLLCYEVIFPALAERRRGVETVALLNLASDSWFPGSVLSEQQIAFGSFRAIEQRLPLLRVAHGGVSAVIDPYGRVQSTLPARSEGSLLADLSHEAPPGASERVALLGVLGMGGVAGFAFVSLLDPERKPS